MNATSLPYRFRLLGVCAFTAASLAQADTISQKRLEQLFRPVLGERMALSSDGKYLAYTEHAENELRIVVMDLDRRESKLRILAADDAPLTHSDEKKRADLRFMEWADGNRLVFAPTIETLGPPVEMTPEGVTPLEPTILAPIQAIDADGKDARTLVDAKTFGVMLESDQPRFRMRPPYILNFDPSDRQVLIVQVPDRGTRQGEETYGVNIHSGNLSRVDGGRIGTYYYDRQGRPRIEFNVKRDGSFDLEYQPVGSGSWKVMPLPLDVNSKIRFVPTRDTYFGERLIPLGFDYSPDTFIYASNVGRDTYAIYGMNLATRERTPLALQDPHHDLAHLNASLGWPGLVFDRFRHTFVGVQAPGPETVTVWSDTELGEIQRTIEGKFPERRVRLADWDERRSRFIVRVVGAADPGRTFLYEPHHGPLVELIANAPWLPSSALHTTRFFEFDGPGGQPLSGYLTLPRLPRITPPPLIVWLAAGVPPDAHGWSPIMRETLGFDAQAQVLADLGFVVCRLNQRGVLGVGARYRDAARRDPAGSAAADIFASIEWIAQRQQVDRKRVAVMGEGFAASLAIRATQLHPDAFRCAVTFAPIFNIRAWLQPPADFDTSRPVTLAQEINRIYLEGQGANLRELEVSEHPNDFAVPLFIARPLVPHDATETTLAAGVAEVATQLKRRGVPYDIVDYYEGFPLGLPSERARVYRKLEEFLNLNLYNPTVKIGPTREVK